jgi:methyl-accepting chemotaxis protein
MKLSFQTKVLAAIALSALLCTTAAVVIANISLNKQGVQSLIEKSQSILRRSHAGAAYVAEMGQLKTLEKEAVERFPDGRLSEEMKERLFRSVPIVAGMKIASMNAEADQYDFRVAANNARNPKNSATAQEKEWLAYFEKNPTIEEKVVEDVEGGVVRVIAPVRISEAQGCLTCHGHPSTSPWGNGKDILGYTLENMKDGDLKGLFIITSSLAPVKAQIDSATLGIVFGALGFTVIALILGILLVRKPIRGIMAAAKRLEGSAQDLNGASQGIASSSEQLSRSTDTQAAALTETAASLEEISAMIKKTSENADESARHSKTSFSQVRQGVDAIREMVAGIERIEEGNQMLMNQVKEGNHEISQIMSVISAIDEKTRVINDIVFQTKLLSFNASVEAARAGEHGKGFSVVAEEIGKLAEVSGRSSKEISDLLGQSIQKVEGILETTQSRIEGAMKEGEQRIHEGRETAMGCERTLAEILSSVELVDQRVEEIARASAEQNIGVEEINKAVVQLSEATSLSVKVSQEAHGTALLVGENSTTLQDLVSELHSYLENVQAANPSDQRKAS